MVSISTPYFNALIAVDVILADSMAVRIPIDLIAVLRVLRRYYVYLQYSKILTIPQQKVPYKTLCEELVRSQ